MNVLLVEDDPTLNKNISDALKSEAYQVSSCFDGVLAEKMLKRADFDCVILDVNLPGKNGFEVCKDFRAYNQHTPVLFLTAFGELEDKIQGFEYGADDYLTKPFFMRELLMRVQALIKRSQGQGKEEMVKFVFDDLELDISGKKLYRQGKEIELTAREYQIMYKLMEQEGELIAKKDLVKEIWGHSIDVNTNTIEVYINFLRNINRSII